MVAFRNFANAPIKHRFGNISLHENNKDQEVSGNKMKFKENI
jgi:hypothetical protein